MNASMRHANLLNGTWIYSRVTLDCGCIKPVANPQREITIYDPRYCGEHRRDVRIVKIEPAVLAEQDALCQSEIELESEIA